MLYTLLMSTNPQGSGQQGGGWASFLPIIAMFAILYFLMILPQQKKQKEMQKMLDALQVNDKVVTSSGIHGRVVNIKSDKNIVVIEIDDTNHVRVEFQREAVVRVLKNTEASAS